MRPFVFAAAALILTAPAVFAETTVTEDGTMTNCGMALVEIAPPVLLDAGTYAASEVVIFEETTEEIVTMLPTPEPETEMYAELPAAECRWVIQPL